MLQRTPGAVLVDSLGTWLTGHRDLVPGTDALVRALVARDDDTVVVSEEVGLAPHAPSELGRRFADELGVVNQRVAAVADRALLVVAGRTLELAPPGEPPRWWWRPTSSSPGCCTSTASPTPPTAFCRT